MAKKEAEWLNVHLNKKTQHALFLLGLVVAWLVIILAFTAVFAQ